ncbi:acylneuraminate cytidylyltransferase [Clostridium sp. Sa3CUN1]|uniref:Acylneuraminate cytidylyltransferase n=1 Tax=Clostridium gallinarum TaxID=2762246 RepID=A0ABR8Q5D3_9CLOT|nr:acylneuraminate cytidylyltransferase [Clostridium gallinarum]MBD7915649.1 acylneuraminate cytidylyltransferase [Clostridium gallinarum]
MKKVCIIQARLGSSRLPNKVLKKINEKTILDIVYERVEKSLDVLDEIIFAIPDGDKDIELEKYLIEKKYKYYKGSELDVLERYYKCALKFNADFIVRVTCDCPIVDYYTISDIVREAVNSNCDYIIKEDMPIGVTSEGFTFKALEKAYKEAKEDYQREHVISYFLDNSEFNNVFIKAEGILNRPDYRFTLDTEEDFTLIKEIYSEFNNDFLIDISKVIGFIDNNNELLFINNKIKQKTYKDYL